MSTVSGSAAPSLFRSFFHAGFECATHTRPDRSRVDVIAHSHHDRHAAEDYRLAAQLGMHTVRDGLRWHLIERSAGHYDWSSFLPMLQASLDTQTQVLWDVCHWGVPSGLDAFSAEFPTRLARFARAAAQVIADHTDEAAFFCPVNEISFWSWIGGDLSAFGPYGRGRGPELKRCLVRAAIAATHAIREAMPQARFVQCEPIIHIAGAPNDPTSEMEAAHHTDAQFEAWDMISGRLAPELGGDASCLDILGCNYYWNNQWVHRRELTPIGHPQHVPLHQLLQQIHRRYGRPLFLSETGVEGEGASGWFGMVCAEARTALRKGVDLQGICLYPVTDYPGWDDGRHCPCGLISIDSGWERRSIRHPFASELAIQQQAMQSLLASGGSRGVTEFA